MTESDATEQAEQTTDEPITILDIYSQVGQLVEVYRNQNRLIEQLTADIRADRSAAGGERAELRSLLIQLRELGRKQVRGLADVERAMYGGLLPVDREHQIADELASIAADEEAERRVLAEKRPKPRTIPPSE